MILNIYLYTIIYDCNTDFSDVSPHKNEKSKLNWIQKHKKKKPQWEFTPPTTQKANFQKKKRSQAARLSCPSFSQKCCRETGLHRHPVSEGRTDRTTALLSSKTNLFTGIRIPSDNQARKQTTDRPTNQAIGAIRKAIPHRECLLYLFHLTVTFLIFYLNLPFSITFKAYIFTSNLA